MSAGSHWVGYIRGLPGDLYGIRLNGLSFGWQMADGTGGNLTTSTSMSSLHAAAGNSSFHPPLHNHNK